MFVVYQTATCMVAHDDETVNVEMRGDTGERGLETGDRRLEIEGCESPVSDRQSPISKSLTDPPASSRLTKGSSFTLCFCLSQMSFKLGHFGAIGVDVVTGQHRLQILTIAPQVPLHKGSFRR